MMRIRSFRRRVLAALLLATLVPLALALTGATLALREVGSTVGTLGPWDAVARSGQTLIESARTAAPDDPRVATAAAAHREALSASVQRARLWALLSERLQTLLPYLAVAAGLLIAIGGYLAARWLSRGLADPIAELVEWTHRIARSEPLPTGPMRADPSEFAVLRASLREMDAELREARQREVETAKLRAWTEMARRVAHELKNPLTPMRMAAGALARRPDPRVAEPAGVLLEEIGRLDDMARTFSQFGRMPEGPAAEVDLVELVESVAERHDSAERPVRVGRSGDIPRIIGHHDALERAVRNLVVNGLEAVRAGDAVPATESAEGGGPGSPDEPPPGRGRAPAVELALSADAGAVRLVVRDRGRGIDPDVLPRIWLPDVTTKRAGTGLGLAMVLQTVEAHGGSVEARNRPGGGAEFELRIPRNRTAGEGPA